MKTTETTGGSQRPLSLSDLNVNQLAARVSDLGAESYRVTQILDGAWRSVATSWSGVTTLGKPLQERLANEIRFSAFDEVERQEAEDGATTKLLLTLSDGAKVEAVLMRSPADPRRGSGPRATVCVSSQAGCAVGCPFCATGELGFTRNLSAGEIQDQVRIARQILRTEDRELTNVVYMGMGEPLQNIDAVFASIDGLTDPARGGIGQRRITVSTSGVVPGIERLAKQRPQITLAVSLHAARNPLRDLLVPLNRKWPVEAVISAADSHSRATGRRTTYEVTMIDGINDQPQDARELARLCKRLRPAAHVNLIPLNPTPGWPTKGTSPEGVREFARQLEDLGVNVTIRRNRGTDIDAACGQLAAGQPIKLGARRVVTAE